MADLPKDQDQPKASQVTLEGGTYEIIRQRLDTHAAELRTKLAGLNEERQKVFGAIPTTLIATERITTEHNCVPRDLVSAGQGRFLFGYNVFIGLKAETVVSDVFAAYEYKDRSFVEIPLDLIANKDFERDFKELYKYYRNTIFAKFSIIGPHLFMVFRVGQNVTDIKVFKWLMRDGELIYQGNRSDHEFRFPSQHEFEWKRTHRDLHRQGVHPHISIEDRVFVETVGGDLTIKVEDNTATGEGIYSEPVDHRDQTLDDAEVFYACVGNIILLKIRPYQERDFRYFVFNDKLKEVRRIDAIEDACVLLPNDQGIIFSSGYYLQLGEFRQFPSQLTQMLFERRIQAPNGEDFLYVFYNRLSGTYVLMSYNIIEQKVEQPIICHGLSLFENGEAALFKGHEEPQRHHVVQIWQTPYLDSNLPPTERKDSYLFKLGNPAIVRCMSECREILTLLNRQEIYADLYIDITKVTSAIIDSYFWLDRPETFDLKATLDAIRQAASAAIDEFDKVVRLQRNAEAEVKRVAKKTRQLIDSIPQTRFEHIDQFVQFLAGLRGLRGELISVKDLRYVDIPRVEALEEEVAAQSEALSNRCVEFLLRPEALHPYEAKVKEHEEAIEHLGKVTEARALGEAIDTTGKELEMLIEIVSNLKIEDSTQTTRIIDNISAIYAPLNQLKAALRRRRQELQKTEGAAQFNAQMRLLDQSAVNFLELCDTPERCEEYLTRAMIQLEELEGRFADFDDYILQLSEKRNELYAAFENRKLALVEARNKRAGSLMAAAERILNGIQHRVENLESINDINGYFASDLMVDRVRDITRQLIELKDVVKSGELQTRLKTIREDAVRQLKDRQELFVDGRNIIQFGKHKFAVNTLNLELTTVNRDGQMLYHLAGTNFFEVIEDEDFLATRSVWDQEVVSENDQIYRGEYLAYRILQALESHQIETTLAQSAAMNDDERLAFVQQFMAPRYSESYTKGIHDQDASRLLKELVKMHTTIGLLRFGAPARACAAMFWHVHKEVDSILAGKLEGFRVGNELFPGRRAQDLYIHELQQLIGEFNGRTGLFCESVIDEAGEYLFQQLTSNAHFVVSPEAARIYAEFAGHLRQKHAIRKFEEARETVACDPRSAFQLIREWIAGFLASRDGAAGPAHPAEYLDEAAAILFRHPGGPHAGGYDPMHVVDASVSAVISKMAGSHPVMKDQTYELNYNAFMHKLQRHERETVLLFNRSLEIKSRLAGSKREELRLDEFRPRVLTSFVRNRLIDGVYLPLIGDNLAKQIGVAGEHTRTDRSGMLLLISPPGYGKTTLMEYIANRLGIIFMKINGPAIGNQVTSLDPSECRNASAREEIEKLNLALEMGDNVMLYLDDIQHCNPELLQKFISLCDAQRKIEGVYKGRARTYDMRGKKVAVVMAGNPYTESGDKFQIPDMLANRADTYNLGDIISGAEKAFKDSYLENALTSNPVLNKLAARSQKDVYAIIKIAETGSREGADFEGSYSVEEINEMVSVMKKLIQVRGVLLRVNQEYIHSASQAEAYRTEPPFRLQGSYRNMARLAEKILPILNDEELTALMDDHYRNEAQTLTTGAEANLLKLKELLGRLTETEAQRWEDIKRTFKRNLLFQGADQKDPVGRVVTQLATFTDGLESIRGTLAEGMRHREKTPGPDGTLQRALEQMEVFSRNLEGIKTVLGDGLKQVQTPAERKPDPTQEVVSQLSAGFETLKSVLADGLKQASQHATFRLIDPSTKADLEVTNVSRDTLAKIWEIIENERKWQDQRQQAESAAPAEAADDTEPPGVPPPGPQKRKKK